MKRMLAIVVLILLGSASGPARAADDVRIFRDWYDDDIVEIIQNVRDVKTKVTTGDIPQTAADLKRQLDLLNSQGMFITETVPDVLDWINHRRTPLRDFLARPGGGHSCDPGSGSTCAGFREDLKGFAQDFASLRSRFPVIDRLGIGGDTFGPDLVEILPGFVLFALYEILNRVPDWQYIPGDLADLYDEIGDPDAFALDVARASAVRASATALRALPLANATPTSTFCENKSAKVDNPPDPVGVNRSMYTLSVLSTVVAAVAEYAPTDLTLTLVGEGVGAVKVPAAAFLKSIASTIQLIAGALNTYLANLQVCSNRLAQIETDLAACTPLVAYKLRTANDEAYAFVQKKIAENAILLPTSAAQAHLDYATALRRNYRYREAYGELCLAYQTLGEEAPPRSR